MFQIPADLFTKKNTTDSTTDKPAVRRHWPVPVTPTTTPFIETTYEYQNINKDVNLRKDVTQFFHKKVLKWINENPEFKKYKPKQKFLESVDGQMHIYNLLRHFIRKSGINWYDLRDNYQLIKEYLSKKI